MITINSDNELVEISSYEELLQRPRFMADLDPRIFTLTKLIGVYGLERACQCGLSDCHTSHNRGYLAATDEGHETNIGHRCGKNIFGANWNALRQRLRTDIRQKRHRELVETFQARIPELLAQAEQLRSQPFGAHWAWHAIARVRQGLPHRVLDKVEAMMRTDDHRIFVSRAANDAEIAAEEVRTRKEVEGPLYVQEFAARLQGLEALKPTSDLRDLLSIGVIQRLKSISELKVYIEKPGVLAEAAKWIESIDARFARVRRTIEQARRLLTKDNLMQLQLLEMSSREIDQLRRMVADLPQSYQDPIEPRAA